MNYAARTALFCSLGVLYSAAAISYTTSGQVLTTAFDTLPNTGTSAAWTNDSTIQGWSLFNSAGSAITGIAVGNGNTNPGSFYSYGTTSASDRALGGLGSGGAYFGTPATGSVAGYVAASYTNASGSVLTAVTINYDGEQWRNGGNTTAHSYNLQYGIGNTFASVTTWSAAGVSFNFTGPVATATAAAVDGNAAGLVSNVGGNLSLTWNVGDTLWIRWSDINEAGNDHGLAIDNFSISAIPEPSSAIVAIAGLGFLALRRRR